MFQYATNKNIRRPVATHGHYTSYILAVLVFIFPTRRQGISLVLPRAYLVEHDKLQFYATWAGQVGLTNKLYR